MSTLKSGNKKTVNIEVRKKRTYVKRSDEELETQAKVEAEQEARTEPVAPQVEFGTGIDDIEEKRQSAIEKRRTAEVEAKQAEEAEKARLDEEAKKAAEAAVVAEQEATKKPAKPAKEAVVEQPAPEKVDDTPSRLWKKMMIKLAEKPPKSLH
jgi:translation initiation factor IF-2